MSNRAQHWQDVFVNSDEARTSWFRPHLDTSLRLIESCGLPASAAIIDVGAGRSTLADDLLARGFRDVTALDISPAALTQSRRRMGLAGDLVRWITGDVLETRLPASRFDLWHDRAVFHFLTEEADQARYAAQAAASIRKGGYLLVATFAADGPEWCSKLPARRYDAAALAACFAGHFERVSDAREEHRTPLGSVQPFTYLLMRRNATE